MVLIRPIGPPAIPTKLHQLEERLLPDVGAEPLDEIGELPFAA